MTSYMYIVQYWVPYPTTEYGGLLAVIAKSNEDCLEQLQKRFASPGHDCFDHGWRDDCIKEIDVAQKFALRDAAESRVVEDFIT